jgi:hypothetical protein
LVDGEWSDVSSYQVGGGWDKRIIPLGTLLPDSEGEYKVRLYSSTEYGVDYVGIDYSKDEDVEIQILKPELVNHSMLGNVTENVTESDDIYAITKVGDQMDVVFEYREMSCKAMNVFEFIYNFIFRRDPCENWKRSFIFVSEGYYLSSRSMYENYVKVDVTISIVAQNPQSCGNMSLGESCNLSWLVNASGGSPYKIDVLFASDDPEVESNDTTNAQVNIQTVTEYGWLNVSLVSPTFGEITSVAQNTTFWVNASVICESGACGEVNGTVRYNATSLEPDSAISTIEGDVPFYSLDPNPQSCGGMVTGDSCTLSWLVNATGEIGSIYKIDVNFTSDDPEVPPNDTANALIEIGECSIAFAASSALAAIDFGSDLIPGKRYNATGNSGDLYNITCLGTCGCDFYINGTDLSNGSYIIGVENVKWNTTNDPEHNTGLSHSYEPFALSIAYSEVVYLYFWITIPEGQEALVYQGNFEILAQVAGAPLP